MDKLFGFGFATARESAWINGGSPTFGFLKFGTTGPFAGFYQRMATNEAVEWMFMPGLLFIGLPSMLGMGVRLAAAGGIAMDADVHIGIHPSGAQPRNGRARDIRPHLPGYPAGGWRSVSRTRKLVKRFPVLE